MHLGSIRTAGMIVLALVGSAAVLALIITATLFLTVQSKTPADVLPARETVLAMFSPTEEDVRRMERWFPVLHDVSVPAGTEAIAVIRLPGGGLAAIRLARDPAGGQQLSPFSAHGDAQAIEVLQNADGHLAQLRPFRTLARKRNADVAWTFADTTAFAAGDGAVSVLLFSDSPFVAIESQPGRITYDTLATTDARTLQTIGRSASGAMLQLSADAPLGALSSIVQKGSPGSHDALRTMLLTEFRRIAGNGVSWEFDIAPLLSGPTTIALGRSASGTLLFGLRGDAGSADALEKAIDRLRLSTAGDGALVEVRTRTFDDRFDARDIRLRPMENPGFVESDRDGWRVLSGTDADGATPLLLAQKGTLFAASNDPLLFEAALARSPATPGTISAGRVRPAELDAWLRAAGIAPNAWNSALLPAVGTGGALQWQALRDGDILQIILQTNDA